MAVGEQPLPTMHPVAGFKLGTTSAGIKTPGRKDLVVMEMAPGSSVAGVYTKNAFCAAPVQLAKRHMAEGANRYWVVNTGNANAGTGEQGMADAVTTCQTLAELASASNESVSCQDVLPFSTGVIGEPLPIDKIVAALPAALTDLSTENWAAAAEGIMTTDTRPKGASVQLEIAGQTVTLTGISKGSGMIKPNMATMLGYIATDAVIAQPLLQELISAAADQSFNRITVDGDTSTNDALMIAATGTSGIEITANADGFEQFEAALNQLAIELAQAIVRDGEGATKFVSVEVSGGASQQECVDVAFTVAESPLVKTALFASDPNWGRILAAVGRAGIESLNVDQVVVHLDDVLLAENGGRAASYTEQAGQAVMDREEITIRIDLGRGDCTDTVWTTDLSYDYVKINAEYRT